MGRITLLIAFLCLAATGCSVNEVVVAEETKLIMAESPVDEAMLLDIGIVEFDAGIPEDNDPQKTRVFEEIRNAETKFLAYHLKTTLQGTGHWGAVRVIPSRSAFTDVVISGAIEKSDGEFVVLNISVDDATGRHWYNKSYETQTGKTSYSERRDRRRDPYQKVFNDVANDLQAFVAQLPAKQLQQTRQVSELQFFADMSPLAYGEHLQMGEEGVVSINRLPAENDPAVMRLRQIRERDRLVVDTLNEHYANFYYGIAIPYRSWRKNARQESVNFREVKRSARMQALVGVVVLAGSLAIDTNSSNSRTRNVNRGLQNMGIYEGLNRVIGGFQRNSEASLHLDTIAELSESFGAEAAPMVVNVEGQERRLSGTAAAQYESWRKLLKEIYEAETGFSQTADVIAPVRAAESTL
ncbi:MAG: hypothetical protein KJO01_01375 [Gammaproteobacteria bacterium]|nr:hypothetical protein [Gammaproteobacteria bacterium]NND48282.1 hypothetical protein [Woeseiaceae bacterium]NNL44422.1 hypothetical protein [Woeseiaceae bacterium]